MPRNIGKAIEGAMVLNLAFGCGIGGWDRGAAAAVKARSKKTLFRAEPGVARHPLVALFAQLIVP
jgi:hypothetical protein